MQVSIPNPCSQPLHEMKPIEGGIHCDVCSHAVIDFRNWSQKEIQDYFKNKSGKTCGIFKKEQTLEDKTVVITPKLNYSRLSFTQQFLYALLICFGSWLFSGCNMFENHTVGKPIPPTETPSPLMGMIESNKPTDSICEPQKNSEQQTLIGNISPIDILPTIPVVDTNTANGDVIPTPITSEPLWFGIIEVMPVYPGGQEALLKFVQDNLIYPEYEKINGIEGKVYVNFVIDEEGNLIDPKIIRSVNGALNFDAEVIRMLKLMPKWKPGTQGGKPIKTKYNLPLEFKLE